MHLQPTQAELEPHHRCRSIQKQRKHQQAQEEPQWVADTTPSRLIQDGDTGDHKLGYGLQQLHPDTVKHQLATA